MAKIKDEFTKYEVKLHEPANFEDWVVTHCVSREVGVNLLKQKRQLACDLDLFKSDFETDYDYINYILLKKEQLTQREQYGIE